MPRPKGKTSTATECVISPWRPVQRSRRDSVSVRDDRSPDDVTPPNELTTNGVDTETSRKLRDGLEAFLRGVELPTEALGVEELEEQEEWRRGICVLAFVDSGGDFVGLILDAASARPCFYLTGTKRTQTFPDCRYNDSQELYELQITDELPGGKSVQVEVINTGGDFGRMRTEEKCEGVGVIFRCVELHGNTSQDSMLREFFEDEDVIVNVGVIWISSLPEA